MLAEFEDINAQFETAEDFDELLAKQAKVQDKLDACDGWNLDSRLIWR